MSPELERGNGFGVLALEVHGIREMGRGPAPHVGLPAVCGEAQAANRRTLSSGKMDPPTF